MNNLEPESCIELSLVPRDEVKASLILFYSRSSVPKSKLSPLSSTPVASARGHSATVQTASEYT